MKRDRTFTPKAYCNPMGNIFRCRFLLYCQGEIVLVTGHRINNGRIDQRGGPVVWPGGFEAESSGSKPVPRCCFFFVTFGGDASRAVRGVSLVNERRPPACSSVSWEEGFALPQKCRPISVGSTLSKRGSCQG